MKKVLLFLLFFVAAANAYAQTSVSNFSTLQSLYQSGGSQNINLASNILFSDWLGSPGMFLSMTVNGGSSYTLDGAGLYGGFYSGPMGAFEFDNTTLQNFVSSGAVSVVAGNLNATNAVFKGNNSIDTGGAVNLALSNATFGGNIEFSSNSTGGSGGGLAVVMGGAQFNGSSYFYGNTAARDGGALVATLGSVVSFAGSAIFENNISTYSGGDGMGGAVAVFQSTVTFAASAEFDNNLANRGGAVSVVNGDNGASYASFSDVVFNDNKATALGGAVFVDYSSADFDGNSAFNGNSAQSGGAVQAELSGVNFNGNSTVFSSNSAVYDPGGAVYSFRSNINFNSAYSTFSYNSSLYNGGAIFANLSSIISTGTSLFTGNTAANNGGAIFNLSSNMSFQNAVFTGNEANASGGAIYMVGAAADVATATFKTSGAGASTVFSGNTAGSVGNGIYVGDYSNAYFITDAGASVEMFDDIASGANNSKIYISGAGDFNLYANSLSNRADIELSGNLNFKNGASLNAGAVTIDAGAVLDMGDNQVNTLNASSINNSGTVNVETFADSNDSLNSSGALVLNSSSSVLNINVQDYTDQRKVYKLFGYGSLTGFFDSVNVSSGGVALDTSVYTIVSGTGYNSFIALLLNGGMQTDFLSSLSSVGSGLTFNQTETARVLDASSSGAASGDLSNAILSIELLDPSSQKAALSETAGYFLANVLRNNAIESENHDVYDKMAHRAEDRASGLWIQAIGADMTHKGDENSINEFRSSSYGAMAGYDKFNSDANVIFGIFGKYKDSSISQDPQNSATVQNAGAGAYLGWISEYVDIKLMAGVTLDSYDTSRYISFMDRTANANFSGLSYGGDIEGAVKIPLSENFKIRPYVGFEAQDSSYKGFSETGADSLDLDVSGGNYLRSAARGGVGLVFDNKSFRFYIQGEGKVLTSGDIVEIESSFDGAQSLLFKTRGYKENGMIYGAGAGFSIPLTDFLRVFANGNYYGADGYQDLYGNIGIRFSFGDSTTGVSAKTSDVKPADNAAAAAPQTQVLPVQESSSQNNSSVQPDPVVTAQTENVQPQEVQASPVAADIPQAAVESNVQAPASSDVDVAQALLASQAAPAPQDNNASAVPVAAAPVSQAAPAVAAPTSDQQSQPQPADAAVAVPDTRSETVPAARPSIVPADAVAVPSRADYVSAYNNSDNNAAQQPAALTAAAPAQEDVVAQPVDEAPAPVVKASPAAPKSAAHKKSAVKHTPKKAAPKHNVKKAPAKKQATPAVKKAEHKKPSTAKAKTHKQTVKKAPVKKQAKKQTKPVAVKKAEHKKPAAVKAKTQKQTVKKAPAKKPAKKQAKPAAVKAKTEKKSEKKETKAKNKRAVKYKENTAE